MTHKKKRWAWLREEISQLDWNGFGMSLAGGAVDAFIGVLLVVVVLR